MHPTESWVFLSLSCSDSENLKRALRGGVNVDVQVGGAHHINLKSGPQTLRQKSVPQTPRRKSLDKTDYSLSLTELFSVVDKCGQFRCREILTKSDQCNKFTQICLVTN